MGYKLLFITHSLNNTGAPLVLLDAMRACRKEGHSVDVVAMEDGPLREVMESEGVFVTVADNFLDELSMWQGIFGRFDAVVANTLVCIEAVYALNTTKVPTMWWIHEHEYWFEYYQQILPKPADLHSNIKVYGVSPLTNEFIKKYCGYETKLLSFGIKDVKEKMPASGDEDTGKVRFICPATYSHVKGQDLLCEAVRRLPSDVREKCEFIMCGATMESEDDYYSTLLNAEREVKELKVLGTLPHDEALLMISKCDYVVVPSRLEPFSATAVEAMMLGRIPVVSSVCGVTEWIKDGENGFVFETENVDSLADALRHCVSLRLTNGENPESRANCAAQDLNYQEIADKARRTYEEFFSMDAFSRHFMDELMEII